MRMPIRLETHHREELVDITERVRAAVRETGIRDGLVALYAQGATAALMIQENWDASVPLDVVGTGSFLPATLTETYATADIIAYDGVKRVKVGREFLYDDK